MTARVIDAEEAVKVGFVSRVVDDPLEEAKKVASELASRSPDAVALTKKLFQETWIDMNEKEALELETELQKKVSGGGESRATGIARPNPSHNHFAHRSSTLCP